MRLYPPWPSLGPLINATLSPMAFIVGSAGYLVMRLYPPWTSWGPLFSWLARHWLGIGYRCATRWVLQGLRALIDRSLALLACDRSIAGPFCLASCTVAGHNGEERQGGLLSLPMAARRPRNYPETGLRLPHYHCAIFQIAPLRCSILQASDRGR